MRPLLLIASLVVLTFPMGGVSLAEIDQAATLESDLSAECLITVEKPGEPLTTQRVALFRRDRDAKFTILVLSPEIDKGKGYLKVGNNLWFYDPVGRQLQVTSAKDRFQNSSARNSDFSEARWSRDYRVVEAKEEKLGKFETTVLTLEATNTSVTFPRAKLWVTADNLVRKSEDYSLSGQLLRRTAIPQYQKVGTKMLPVKVTIVDLLRGRIENGVMKNETTIIEMLKPSAQNVKDIIFTPGYLEKVSK